MDNENKRTIWKEKKKKKQCNFRKASKEGSGKCSVNQCEICKAVETDKQ